MFNNMFIYKLFKTCDENFYIGSTNDMKKRMWQHKSVCYNENNQQKFNMKVYQYIRMNGGFEKWSFEVLECFDCDSKELKKKEDEYIVELKPTLNAQRASRNKQQYNDEEKDKAHEYYIKNKTVIYEKKKTYRKNNPELRKVKVICECGCEVLKEGLIRHKKTVKHLKYINLL